MLKMTNLIGFGGGSSSPNIISDASVTSLSGETMAFTIIASQPCTLVIGGADAAEVELVSNTLNINHTLRWIADGTKDPASPDDADTDNYYEITITPTNAFGAAGPAQSFTVFVDYDWEIALSFDFNFTSGDYDGYTLRETFGGAIILNGNSHCRLQLQATNAGPVNIDKLYIGEKAAAGDVYDMKASTPSPAQFEVEGSTSFVIPTGETIYTDILSFVIDDTKSYVVTAHFNGAAMLPYRTGFPSNVDVNLKTGVDEAATADVTGYTPLTAGTVMLVKRIETVTP